MGKMIHSKHSKIDAREITKEIVRLVHLKDITLFGTKPL